MPDPAPEAWRIVASSDGQPTGKVKELQVDLAVVAEGNGNCGSGTLTAASEDDCDGG